MLYIGNICKFLKSKSTKIIFITSIWKLKALAFKSKFIKTKEDAYLLSIFSLSSWILRGEINKPTKFIIQTSTHPGPNLCCTLLLLPLSEMQCGVSERRKISGHHLLSHWSTLLMAMGSFVLSLTYLTKSFSILKQLKLMMKMNKFHKMMYWI